MKIHTVSEECGSLGGTSISRRVHKRLWDISGRVHEVKYFGTGWQWIAF